MVCLFCRLASASGSYRAAVVEFAPVQAAKDAAVDEVQALKLQNFGALAAFAKEAKANGSQIIVFPEYGITGDGDLGGDFTRKSVQPFLEEIPKAENPCQEKAALPASSTIVQASCLARNLSMVVVFNLATREQCIAGHEGCPGDGQLVHNTAIAIGENGAILSVYHKRHLFGDESGYMNPSSNPKARFKTGFGVTFGMFICFDMLWEIADPDVTDFVFPTDWVNNAYIIGPKAIAAQETWAWAHQKNLLASNYGGFAKESSGSGIYSKGRTLTSFYNPTKSPQSKLLIADVPYLSLDVVHV